MSEAVAITLVGTIAALRAITWPSLACYVEVAGYLTAGDGGGGSFRWVTADTAADNGGTIIAPTAGGGRFYRIYEGALNVRWYGAAGSGVTDDTVSIQKALTQSAVDRNRPVHFPCGDYLVSAPLVVPGGTMLTGCGSQGSTIGYGTTLLVAHAGNGVSFDPTTGIDYAGTGGGMRDFLMVKQTGFSGGDAILVLAVNDNRRPGEMVFENVLVYGSGTGRWTRGVHLNGSACNTPGARGIRSVMLLKVRMTDIVNMHESFVFNQVVSVYGLGIQADQGSGAAAGFTMDGFCDNVSLNVVCNGNFVIAAAATVTGLCLTGRVSLLNNAATSTLGTAEIYTTNLVTNKSADFRVIASGSTGMICLYKNASVTNATGDNTSYAIAFDAVDKDSGFNASLPTTEASVLCAGTYVVEAQILVTNLAAGHTRSDSYIGHLNAAGTPLATYTGSTNPYATAFGTTQGLMTMRAILECAYGDKIRLICNVSGSTKTVTVYGVAGTNRYTYLQIKRIA